MIWCVHNVMYVYNNMYVCTGGREGEREREKERESYFASCFHCEEKSADPMTVSSMNMLMKTGT